MLFSRAGNLLGKGLGEVGVFKLRTETRNTFSLLGDAVFFAKDRFGGKGYIE